MSRITHRKQYNSKRHNRRFSRKFKIRKYKSIRKPRKFSKKTQKGGLFLASGSGGTVYTPTIPCTGETNSYDDAVSKIMFKPSECDIEMSKTELIKRKLTPEQFENLKVSIAMPIKSCKLSNTGLNNPFYKTDEWLQNKSGGLGNIAIDESKPNRPLYLMKKGKLIRYLSRADCQVIYEKASGDLYDLIREPNTYPELLALYLKFIRIILGVADLQVMNIIQADLKPENVLVFNTTAPDSSTDLISKLEKKELKIADLGEMFELTSISMNHLQRWFVNRAAYIWLPPSSTWCATVSVHVPDPRPRMLHKLYTKIFDDPFMVNHIYRIWSIITNGVKHFIVGIEPSAKYSNVVFVLKSFIIEFTTQKTFGVIASINHPTDPDTGRYYTREEIIDTILAGINYENPDGTPKPFNKFLRMMNKRYAPDKEVIKTATGELNIIENPRLHKILKHVDIYSFGIMLMQVLSASKLNLEHPVDFAFTPEMKDEIHTIFNYLELACACTIELDEYPDQEDIFNAFSLIINEYHDTQLPLIERKIPPHLQYIAFWKLFELSPEMVAFKYKPVIGWIMIEYSAYMQAHFYVGIWDKYPSFRSADIDSNVANITKYVLDKHDDAIGFVYDYNDIDPATVDPKLMDDINYFDSYLRDIYTKNIIKYFGKDAVFWGDEPIVPVAAVPTDAVPTDAVPTDAVPTDAAPDEVIPVPQDVAQPSNASSNTTLPPILSASNNRVPSTIPAAREESLEEIPL